MFPSEIEVHMRKLIQRERLDNFAQLLEPRELDEVPLFSRYKNIDFLSSLPAVKKTEVLTVFAVRYLVDVFDHVEPGRRSNTVIMVSITRWEDLDDLVPEPALPNFWICGDKKRDLGIFRLMAGQSPRAQLVREWLREAGIDQKFAVYEPTAQNQKLGRIYVALRDDPTVADLIVPRDGAAESGDRGAGRTKA